MRDPHLGVVTMKTLAARLGVSVATVSNAYSRPDQLSADLRARVLAAAEEVGYEGPSAAGRALRSGRTGACGFLFGGRLADAFSDPYTVLFLAGVSQSLEALDASVLLLRSAATEDSRSRLRNAAVDAVIVSSTAADHGDVGLLRRRGVRIVGTRHGLPGAWVAIDDVAGARDLATHLIGLGHRRVVVIAAAELSDGVGPGSYEVPRIRGLQDGLGLPSLRVVVAGANTREAGRRAAALALEGHPHTTAVVALSDVLAFGVLEALRDWGLRPGRDISVCGFDDLPEAEAQGLTTVHQPAEEKGRLAGRLAMDPEFAERQITLPARLMVRGSTGPASGPGPH